jgi:transposase-like protein
MTGSRRRHNSQFKFQVALDAAKGLKTINQLAGEYGLHPSQITQWKRQLVDGGPVIFNQGNDRKQREHRALEADLYEQIGRLKVELEWLKKKATRCSG